MCANSRRYGLGFRTSKLGIGRRWRLEGARRDWSGDVAEAACFESGEDLGLEVVGGTGVVGEEDGAGSALGADVAKGVEVLGEEDEGHDVFGGGTGDGLAKVFNGGAETVDDGLTLGRDALALESF